MAWVVMEGGPRLRRQLKSLGRGVATKIGKRAVREEMKPVLRDARAATPVVSGRLRKSIGLLTEQSRRRGSQIARVGARRNVAYTHKKTRQKRVTGRGKMVTRRVAQGYALDKYSVNHYAGFIEFGTRTGKSGVIRRKAGAAHMLNRSMDRHRARILRSIKSTLRREIDAARKK